MCLLGEKGEVYEKNKLYDANDNDSHLKVKRL
jgi:hypothetical protein